MGTKDKNERRSAPPWLQQRRIVKHEEYQHQRNKRDATLAITTPHHADAVGTDLPTRSQRRNYRHAAPAENIQER